MKYYNTAINTVAEIIRALDNSEEQLRRAAADAAAAEAGYETGCLKVTLFSDETGNYAEVLLSGGGSFACGMNTLCIVDTDTMEVRGVLPVTE